MEISLSDTSSKAVELHVRPWYDRVDTKSSPVDGLSRANFEGNLILETIAAPDALIRDLHYLVELPE